MVQLESKFKINILWSKIWGTLHLLSFLFYTSLTHNTSKIKSKEKNFVLLYTKSVPKQIVSIYKEIQILG